MIPENTTRLEIVAKARELCGREGVSDLREGFKHEHKPVEPLPQSN
jgi:hypothetical protein